MSDNPMMVWDGNKGVAEPADDAFLAQRAIDLAVSPTQLAAHAQAKHAAVRDGGITVDVGTASAPQVVDVATDAGGRTLVTGSVQLIGLASQNGQPAPTFRWVNNDGSTIPLSAAQMMTIGYAFGAFVQATYAELGAVRAAITDGTITTFDGIDAAAWPATAIPAAS